MTGDSYTKARAALVAALRRLDEEAQQPGAIPNRLDESSAQAPMVLVLLGEQPAPAPGATSVVRAVTTGSGRDSIVDVSHPSRERYVLPSAQALNAPRPCFVEPDRFCIDSGCCESRGF